VGTSPIAFGDGGGDDVREGTCNPTAFGPTMIEEGDDVVLRLGCATGLALPPAKLRISPMPGGSTWDGTLGELRWTPERDQAGVYEMTVSVRGTSESGRFTLAVADAFDHPENRPLAFPESYSEEMGLPVVHLTLSPQFNHDDYTPATFVYRNHVYQVEAKHRGRSSSEYPKRSVTVKFLKADPFREPVLGGGFPGVRKVALIANFDDNSGIRQRLSFALWNRLGRGNIQIRHMSVVVYLDGRYEGLYTLADLIDGDLMAAHGLDPDGNLYKAVSHAADFYPLSDYAQAFEKKEGFPVQGRTGAYDDLAGLVDFISNTGSEDFRAQIGDVLSLSDYQSWFLLVTAIQASDTFGKNAYHYHDARAGGRWRFIPWDFNASFGQNWRTDRDLPLLEPSDVTSYNQIFARMVEDPALSEELRQRYGQALRGELDRDAVLTLVDAYASEVARSAQRDERRWGQAYRSFPRWSERQDFTNFTEEIAYLRRWVRDRWSFLEQRFAEP
jgi:spore coat protein H